MMLVMANRFVRALVELALSKVESTSDWKQVSAAADVVVRDVSDGEPAYLVVKNRFGKTRKQKPVGLEELETVLQEARLVSRRPLVVVWDY
jgi:hypothetical protein